MIVSNLQRMTPGGNIGEVDNFTVSLAATSVAVSTGSDPVLYANSIEHHCWFSGDQGAMVMALSLWLPSGFQFSSGVIQLDLNYEVDGGGTYPVPELSEGLGGWLTLPLPNVEIPVNVYVAPPPEAVTSNSRWRFKMLLIPSPSFPLSVSMIGVSALVDTFVFPVYLNMKVMHSIELEPLS